MDCYLSPEADKLQKVISSKKTYLKSLMEKGNKPAAMMMNAEVMFLEKDILPLLLRNTDIHYNEICNYVIRGIETARKYKCNGMALYLHLEDNYTDKPKVGILNTKQLVEFGTTGAIEISITNLDGNDASVEPFNLPLNELL